MNHYFRLNLPHRNSNNVDDEETQASVSSAELSEEDNLDFNQHRRDSRMLRLQHESVTDSTPTLGKMLNGKPSYHIPAMKLTYLQVKPSFN